MPKYRLRVVPYTLHPVELALAGREILSLFGAVEPQGVSPNGTLTTTRPVQISRLRRPAFCEAVELLNNAGKITRVTLTEQRVLECPALASDPSQLEFPFVASSSRGRNGKHTTYASHGLHDYKGKFYPQLVRAFLNLAGARSDSLVLDPFNGSGTTTLEASLYGVDSIGVDCHPLANLIADAKIAALRLNPDHIETRLGEVLAAAPTLEAPWLSADSLEYLKRWFPLENLAELIGFLSVARALQPSGMKKYLQVLISGVVRRSSLQEPTQLRIRRRQPSSEPERPHDLLANHGKAQLAKLREFQTAATVLKLNGRLGDVSLNRGDIRQAPELLRHRLGKRKVDIVITSPPYATALPYIDTDRLSLVLLGLVEARELSRLEDRMIGNREIGPAQRCALEEQLRRAEFEQIPSAACLKTIRFIRKANASADVGFRKRNTAGLLFRYFSDMTVSLRGLYRVIARGGQMFIVVGNNQTCVGDDAKPVEIKTDQYLVEIAEACGFKLIENIEKNLTSKFNATTVHYQNAMSEESVLWFQKK